MGLNLGHRIHGHADDDQKAGAAEVERHRILRAQQLRQEADRREIGGEKLFDKQLPQAHIADSAVSVDAAALLVYRAAWIKDTTGGRISRESSMAKLFATEEAQKVIDTTVQLFGGEGVVSGNKAEQLYREIRAVRIYEGASDIQKLIIADQVRATLTS